MRKLQVPTSTIQFLWWGYRILPFWGLAEVRFLFYLKKHTSEHPLPDLRPDLEYSANLGLEQTFNIFKNIQKHISSSGVCKGNSKQRIVHVVRKPYCTLGFQWIMHFWYFFFQEGYKVRPGLYPIWKQKYQKWIKDYVSKAESSKVREVSTFLYLLKFRPAFTTQF